MSAGVKLPLSAWAEDLIKDEANVKKISYAVWNPVPPNVWLRGDVWLRLQYGEVVST